MEMARFEPWSQPKLSKAPIISDAPVEGTQILLIFFETSQVWLGEKFQNLEFTVRQYSWIDAGICCFRNVIYLLVFWVASLVIVGMIVSII